MDWSRTAPFRRFNNLLTFWRNLFFFLIYIKISLNTFLILPLNLPLCQFHSTPFLACLPELPQQQQKNPQKPYSVHHKITTTIHKVTQTLPMMKREWKQHLSSSSLAAQAGFLLPGVHRTLKTKTPTTGSGKRQQPASRQTKLRKRNWSIALVSLCADKGTYPSNQRKALLQCTAVRVSQLFTLIETHKNHT